ncbi:MAG: MaoC family dehydratase [Sinobacteraceae bacterium]|nr:MaoC family dehydratase [Nevskiaceae bacterium]MBV9913142.1 MaoC family dehydratase [Nevskiaceae bacterium]
MLFQHMQVGQRLRSGPRRVSEEEIIEFASRYDPQPFHIDAARARHSRWKGLIASGWMTCAVAMEMAVQLILAESDSLGSPGVDQLRWVNPVRPGDELTLLVEFLEKRLARNGVTGVIRARWVLTNQEQLTVLEMSVISLFDLAKAGRDPAGSGPASG